MVAGASSTDSEARLTLPPSNNWFDLTLLTNPFLAFPLCLFPFHTIIRKIVSRMSHFLLLSIAVNVREARALLAPPVSTAQTDSFSTITSVTFVARAVDTHSNLLVDTFTWRYV